MIKEITIICENSGTKLQVSQGSTLKQILSNLELDSDFPILAAYVNNRVRELGYTLFEESTIRFIDLSCLAGQRVYERTISFVLQKAVEELYPDRTLHIRNSLGSSGFYCEVKGVDNFTQDDIESLRARMRTIVESDLPIECCRMLTSELREEYIKRGYHDKVQLLDSQPHLYSEVYRLDNTIGYFYGSLAPSTRYANIFEVSNYYRGFYLALPLRNDPSHVCVMPHQEKMSSIFHEYQSWVNIMGVPTVGELNAKVKAGDASEMIKIAEALYGRKLSGVADQIADASTSKGCRMVLISGPSSSGKTTTAKRLGIQLQVLGFDPVLISLDDYFVNRVDTPKDENGNYDFEALEAIDLEQFNDHLLRLFKGESVEIPRYDFISGTRKWHENPLTMGDRSILIVEGIHGLNPRLTPAIDDRLKFKIYVSCITSVAMDNCSRIATSDNRLLRRLTRDYTQRGHNGQATLAQWASVRMGEHKHIFPYQENADVIINSSLFYEISVIKPFAKRILHEVDNTTPCYEQARRLLKFLDNFTTIAPDEIPPTSVLREFIGGSSFKY